MQTFPSLVMELDLKKAIGFEVFRNDEEGDFFFIRMAKWIGSEQSFSHEEGAGVRLFSQSSRLGKRKPRVRRKFMERQAPSL